MTEVRRGNLCACMHAIEWSLWLYMKKDYYYCMPKLIIYKLRNMCKEKYNMLLKMIKKLSEKMSEEVAIQRHCFNIFAIWEVDRGHNSWILFPVPLPVILH